MNKQMMFTIGMTVFLLAGVQPAAADVPSLINYSGELVETTTGTEQTMADKNGLFYVRLYSSPTTNVALWARAYTVIMNQGKFDISISENTGGSEINASGALTNSLLAALHIQATDPSSEALYIGVRPLADTAANEIMPRQRVVSVPFAMLANDAVAARRNFTVANGAVTVKNLTVQNAVFSNTVTIAGLPATSAVMFATSPLFAKGMTSSQADKAVQVSRDAAVSGITSFNNGLTVTNLTSTEASTLSRGLTVGGQTSLAGGLSVSGDVLLSSYQVFVNGAIKPVGGMTIGEVRAMRDLTATNTSFSPVSMVGALAETDFVGSGTTNSSWSVTNDCFVVASVEFLGRGTNSTSKLSAKFYASPTPVYGGGTFLTEVGMGVKAGNTTYQGTTSASFFLKRDEYLTWFSSNGAINLKLIYRSLIYHN